MRSPASCPASQSTAPLTTVPVEPPKRNPRLGQAVADPDGVRLLDVHHVVDDRTRRAAAAGPPCPGRGSSGGRRRTTERDRADRVDGDDPHLGVPLAEVAGAAHQGARRAGPDEQHIEVRELAGDAGAVVR